MSASLKGLVHLQAETSTRKQSLDQKAETTAQIKAILEIMNPHMKRWKLIRIELEYSSSLPCPRIDLMGCADQLETLELECAINDLTIAADSPPTLGEFHTPALRRLSIYGAHFRGAYLRPFPQVAMPALLLDITIGHYGAHHPPLALVDLLRCLIACRELADVRLASLTLDSSYTGPALIPGPGIRRDDLMWSLLRFDDMPCVTVGECNRLLDWPYIDTVVYSQCPLGTTSIFFDASNLHLYDIDIESTTVLFASLASVRGQRSYREVTFTNCPGLIPEVWSLLNTGVMTNTQWHCSNLIILRLEDCHEFTSSDLRMFLQARREKHAETGFVDENDPAFVVRSVDELEVSGCCELAQDDKEWLDANVGSVWWNDWQGGYERRKL